MKPDRIFSITLTAPGNDVHFIRGQIQCPCTPPGGVDLRVWNGQAASRFNRWKQDMERKYGCRFEHFRAVECQERGAIHYHVSLRSDRPVVIRKSRVRALAMKHGFGHEVDVQPIESERCASYQSSYVSKTADERPSVPYMHPRTGEVGPGRWRTWSSSRRWGDSMRVVRAAQAAYMRRLDREAAEHEKGGEPAARPAPPAPPAALDTRGLNYTRGRSVLPFWRSISAM